MNSQNLQDCRQESLSIQTAAQQLYLQAVHKELFSGSIWNLIPVHLNLWGSKQQHRQGEALRVMDNLKLINKLWSDLIHKQSKLLWEDSTSKRDSLHVIIDGSENEKQIFQASKGWGWGTSCMACFQQAQKNSYVFRGIWKSFSQRLA